MKLAIISFTLVALAVAFPVDEKYEFHHVQHQSSVDAARQGLSTRLSQLERQTGVQSQQRLQSGYGNSANCLSCTNGYASQSSRSSNAALSSSLRSNTQVADGSENIGVGYLAYSNDNTGDVQSQVSPSSSTYGRYASAKTYEEEEEEEENTQQRQVNPTSLNGIGASAYRASHASYDEDDTQKTSGVGYHDASVNSENNYGYSSRRKQQQQQAQVSESESTRSTPSVYYVPAPVSSSSQSQRQSSADSTQHYRVSVRPGSSTVLQVPVRVIQTSGTPDQTQQQYSLNSRNIGYQASDSLVNQPSQRVVSYYVPVSSDRRDSASSRSEHDSSRVIVQQPERYIAPDLTSYNSYGSQSRSQADDLQENEYQTRIQPSLVDGGSSRYASAGIANSQRTQSRVVPINSIESSSASSLRSTEEQQQHQQIAARPNYVHRTANTNEESNRRAESSSTYGSSGSTVYLAPISTQSRNQQQQQSTQFNSRAGYNGNIYSPYSPSYSSSRQGSGILSANTENLHEYMSESQRLAELQQRQLAASQQQSSSFSSASEANRRTVGVAQRLDNDAANFVGSTNLANRNSELDTESLSGTGAGNGYQRVKSWQKQSKWESGSQYGSDGAPKTYSMLSTAEAEKHNINGAEAGYKAATTTLENDGKVSTYSIHTP